MQRESIWVKHKTFPDVPLSSLPFPSSWLHRKKSSNIAWNGIPNSQNTNWILGSTFLSNHRLIEVGGIIEDSDEFKQFIYSINAYTIHIEVREQPEMAFYWSWMFDFSDTVTLIWPGTWKLGKTGCTASRVILMSPPGSWCRDCKSTLLFLAFLHEFW